MSTLFLLYFYDIFCHTHSGILTPLTYACIIVSMYASWQVFTAISVVSLSISVILQRVLIHKSKINPYAYVVVFQGLVGILLLGLACVFGFSLSGIQNYILPSIISIVCFGIGHIFYAKTLQKVEASSFSVLFATQSIWTMLLGVLLIGENITALQIIGTVLIFISAGMLAKNFRTSFRDHGTLLGLATGVLFGVAVYFWSIVGRHVDGMSWAAISFIAISLLVLMVRPATLSLLKPLLSGSTVHKLLLLAIFYGLGSVTMLFAYQAGSFTVVSPLRQTSILVTVLLALIFLPFERTRITRKMLAAVICMIGVICILI